MSSRGLTFVGRLPSSGAILHRLLLVKSYFSALDIEGANPSRDIRLMGQAVLDLAQGREMDVGDNELAFRFMCLRAARTPGVHRIRHAVRSPQTDLLKILKQLGLETKLTDSEMEISGEGWRLHGDTLLVPVRQSSQYASAVLLNAWNLPFDLYVSLGGVKVPEGHWRMSVRLAQDLGMRVDFWDGDFRVPRGQSLVSERVEVETDLGLVAILAAVASVSGSATFLDYPTSGLQPEGQFLNALEKMGVPMSLSLSTLRVDKSSRFNGIAVNARGLGELVPVLAAVCALAAGESEFYGGTRSETMPWVEALGRTVELDGTHVLIRGNQVPAPGPGIVVSGAHDHRLAFAGAVLREAGYEVRIEHPEAVEKSFPDFWNILGWRP